MSKLIFITTIVYPNSINPASGMFVYDFAIMLKNMGYKLVVIDVQDVNYKQWLKSDFKNIEHRTDDNIDIFTTRYRAFRTYRYPEQSFKKFNKKFVKAVDMAIEEYGEPDIVFSHFTLFAGLASVKYFENKKIPVINIEHHSLFLAEKLNPFILNSLNKTVRLCKKFIVVSEHLNQNIERYLHDDYDIDKFKIIPNTVSSDFKFVQHNPKNTFKFFAVGNLIPSKNFETLIRAFILGFSESDNVSLTIAGNGELMQSLQSLISSQGREQQIKLLGTQSREQIVSQMSSCSVFTMLSLYETFGIVYREAMMVGRPIVSYKNGGVLENWKDYLGILISDNDVEVASNALKEMREKYIDFDQSLIHKHAYELYSIESISQQYKKIISDII